MVGSKSACARTEGILPAPESSHAIKAAIEEAKRADAEGKPRGGGLARSMKNLPVVEGVSASNSDASPDSTPPIRRAPTHDHFWIRDGHARWRRCMTRLSFALDPPLFRGHPLGRCTISDMKRVNPRDLKKLLSRPGVRLEVGQPFPVGDGSRFMCLAKFVVPSYRVRRIVSEPPSMDETEHTNTMCIVSEEGASLGEAHRNLMDRLGEARTLTTVAPSRPRRGWLGRLIRAFA